MIQQNKIKTAQDLFLQDLNELVFNYTDIQVDEYIYERSEIEDIFENITHMNDLFNILCEKNAFHHLSEFIYYSDAIEYLNQNDYSLTDSFEIAKEMGFTLDKLDSCILATIHKERKLEGDFFKLTEDVNKMINEYSKFNKDE
tara:strand:- start:222 stop:650 length:429 start_codon:yes stop_codon:yes gene_type:complete